MEMSGNFRTAFCAHARCADAAFERTLFWQGLYRHAVPLALLIRWFAPNFFRPDEEFIRFVGADASLAEVEEDMERFEYGNRVQPHWLRTGLLIRVNQARIAALARTCLAV